MVFSKVLRRRLCPEGSGCILRSGGGVPARAAAASGAKGSLLGYAEEEEGEGIRVRIGWGVCEGEGEGAVD